MLGLSPDADDAPSPDANEPRKSILVLHGMAGTGKSTIANTIASRLKDMRRLGASYCFSRDVKENAKDMFLSIAKSIATLDECFKVKLAEAINKNGLCGMYRGPSCYHFSPTSLAALSDQFKEFIQQPMKALMRVGTITIVIDALDECDHNQRQSIMKILSEGEFPDNIQFIITTRPERRLIEQLHNKSHILMWDLDEMAEKSSVHEDIRKYINHRLLEANVQVPETSITQLVEKAQGYFQWAALACDQIGNLDDELGVNPHERLTLMLIQGEGLTGIYSLYTLILKQKFPRDEKRVRAAKSILAKVLAASEPLSMAVLKALCIDDEECQMVDLVIPYLRSVLTVRGGGLTPIRPIHTSFRDFLTNPSLSGELCVDIAKGHQDLAFASFRLMTDELRFNICEIKSSFDPNSSLSEDELSRISPQLFYSSRFWSSHLAHIPKDDVIDPMISQFMSKQLLFWLEVLSIKDAMSFAEPAMESLLKVC